MARIKFNPEHIKILNLFERVTRVPAKDCIIDEKEIVFIVSEGYGSRAIGKKGQNAKKLEKILSKRIKIAELSEDITTFISNLCYPLKNIEIEQQDDNITIKGHDVKTKGLLIGRNSKNLKKLESMVKRYFDFNKIIVK